jgi:hypothetical protein
MEGGNENAAEYLEDTEGVCDGCENEQEELQEEHDIFLVLLSSLLKKWGESIIPLISGRAHGLNRSASMILVMLLFI